MGSRRLPTNLMKDFWSKVRLAEQLLAQQEPTATNLQLIRDLLELRARSWQPSGKWNAPLLKPFLAKLKSQLFSDTEKFQADLLNLATNIAFTQNASPDAGQDKPSLVYLTHFDVFSFNGGAIRVLGLAKALSTRYKVSVISLVGENREFEIFPLCQDCRIYNIPVSKLLAAKIQENRSSWGDASFSLTLATHYPSEKLLRYWLKELVPSATEIILNQPYLIDLLNEYVISDQRVVYDVPENNRFFIERLVKRGGTDLQSADELQQRLEKAACERADSIGMVSDQDSKAIIDNIGQHIESKLCRAPNGIDSSAAMFFPPCKAESIRDACGFPNPIAVFIGTPYYHPNEYACEHILARMAPACPEITFIICGMLPEELPQPFTLPANVIMTGKVTDRQKEAIMAAASIGLAPLPKDSGSSLKTVDYMAHGKAVLTTENGLRGFPELEPFCTKTDIASFESKLGELVKTLHGKELDKTCRDAREMVVQTFDWSVVAAALIS